VYGKTTRHQQELFHGNAARNAVAAYERERDPPSTASITPNDIVGRRDGGAMVQAARGVHARRAQINDYMSGGWHEVLECCGGAPLAFPAIGSARMAGFP